MRVDSLTGMTESQLIARDQEAQAESFFAEGWTTEHSVILFLTFVVFAGLGYLATHGKWREYRP